MTATASRQQQQPSRSPETRTQDRPNGAPEMKIEPDGKRDMQMILDGKAATYTPLAEQNEIVLTINLVKRMLCVPTKSGKEPTDQDCVKYIMMCKQRGLNPWAQDCYLLGYDSTKYGPTFSMVVAIQALLKRAELARTLDGSPAFDGMDSGVIVERKISDIGEDLKPRVTSMIIESVGDIIFPGETLLGGWAKVYRKDRGRPFYQRLALQTYKKPTPMWDNDAAGMICKDAEAAALRQAFPSDIGGLYLASEIEAFAEDATKRIASGGASSASDRGTVNLDNLSPQPGTPADQTSTVMRGEESSVREETSSVGADEHSQASGEELPEGEVGHDTGGGEVTPEEELNSYAFDIDKADERGLARIAKDAEQATESIRLRVFKMITDRRAALGKLSGSSAKQQPALPGAQ